MMGASDGLTFYSRRINPTPGRGSWIVLESKAVFGGIARLIVSGNSEYTDISLPIQFMAKIGKAIHGKQLGRQLDRN